MNKDVIQHIIKLVKSEMGMCQIGNLIHEGGKEDALDTYERVLQILESDL